MQDLIPRVIPWPDLAALVLFCAMWLGYGPFVRWFAAGAINSKLHSVRVLWMRSMLMRDNRIPDAALIGHVVHSTSFFASTSLIAIGALLGVLTGALSTFNVGIRSYYFAIAGLTWLAGPWPLAASAFGLGALLMHRQLGSSVAAKFHAARLLTELAHQQRDASTQTRAGDN
jgi:uncharacterized membrane protein